MPEAGETVLEIDLRALKNNYKFLKSRIHSSTLFLAVVKANAYGHGAIEIARYLQDLGVDYLAVAYTEEGVTLRKNGISAPILVLHPQPVNFEKLIDNNLEPNLYNNRTLEAFIATSESKNQTKYPIHIKFNTGLNRLGFSANEMISVVNKISSSTAIKAISVFSHLAASEDMAEKDFTLAQIEAFNKTGKLFAKKIGYTPLMHQLNTSGILNYPEAQYDMVRSGIGLYGYGNDPIYKKNLIPVASLKSVISQIHSIGPGESVGYNRAFTAQQSTKIATIPIGHADGIGRHYGNRKAYVLINGQKAPIEGNVCMDMLMVNVSGIRCKEGDAVVLFGNEVSAAEFASAANTISYEILTAISPRVRRIYTNK